MDITFIIPVRLESDDRKENAKITLSYLFKHHPYNFIIYEDSIESNIPEILKSIDLNNSKVNYIFNYNRDKLFHKTKIINFMIQQVETPVVINYDIDILFIPTVIPYCYDLILKDGYDIVFPYFRGESLLDIKKSSKFKIVYDLSVLDTNDFLIKIGNFGMCQIFKTPSIIEIGMMNEKFISYGPEDWEIAYRFEKLGYKICRSNNYIFHLDHNRGINSSLNNPEAINNYKLFDYLKNLSTQELKTYYNGNQ
jgi:hypothetical protein